MAESRLKDLDLPLIEASNARYNRQVQMASAVLAQWGPALLVCFTVIIGLFYSNTRTTDLKESFNKRFDDLKTSMDSRQDDLRNLMDSRYDDLRNLMDSRHNDLRTLMDNRHNDLKTFMDNRHNDLKSYIGSEFKRVDERIDRLASPLVR